MIIIAHRANMNGPNSLTENSLESIQDCFAYGFHVEIDVWYEKGIFWLGHDEPTYKLTDNSILLDEKTWSHAKNLEAAEELKKLGAHYFWHQEDDFTLTSRGYFWTYPGKKLGENSIAVMPEVDLHEDTFSRAIGVCSDYPLKYIAI
jgi:glycerophosphoryl diester phosphodiesterase